jgi:hypothetical protein
VDYRGLLAAVLILRRDAKDQAVIDDLDCKITLFQAATDFKDTLERLYERMRPQPAEVQ